ncbi:DUF1826 domain-containing protein [Halopseudomonas salegens]|uniref:DUF1826 domain-containing protein n=1 Tax=Halopseudomonas salegens TaxID=1434072 RepID=A0A1H2GE74_9GAMM|nr:DUF1826 domain-containing protein [Halopseudomonas salegens]SDU18036.1 Protein of unknown function [Halopseudomonas salegens]
MSALARSAASWPHVAQGAEAEVLLAALNDGVNLAVWQRSLTDNLQGFVARALASQAPLSVATSITLASENEAPDLSRLFAGLEHVPGHADFVADVQMLVAMYACLLDAECVGLRLRVLDRAMCPRWHVDKVGIRLVTTYYGPGTEWLQNDNLPRDDLGSPAADAWTSLPATGSVDCGSIALLKGESWPGDVGQGIVHRSPRPVMDESRLMLSLDAIG